MSAFNSPFAMVDSFETTDTRGIDQERVRSCPSWMSLRSTMSASSFGHAQSSLSNSGRAAFGQARQPYDDPESSDDEEGAFDTVQSAVESLLGEMTLKDVRNARKAPYFTRPNSPLDGKKAPSFAISRQTTTSSAGAPSDECPFPGISPHASFRAPTHLPTRTPPRPASPQVVPQASPRPPPIVHSSSPAAVPHSPILQPAGVISIGGQPYLLVSAQQPSLGYVPGSPVPQQPQQPQQPPQPFYPPLHFPPQSQRVSPASRAPALSPRPVVQPRSRADLKPAAAGSFRNIQVLSDKLDTKSQHGYYLVDTCGQELETLALSSPEAPPPESNAIPNYPTYTYDYGTELNAGVLDILRKSVRPSS